MPKVSVGTGVARQEPAPISYASVPTLQGTASETGAAIGILGKGLSEGLEALALGIKKGDIKTQKMMKEHRVQQSLTQSGKMYADVADVLSQSFETKADDIGDEQFDMQTRLKVLKTLGSDKYAMVSASDRKALMGIASDVLKQHGETKRVFENGSIITYDTLNGEVNINTDPTVQAEILSNKALMKFGDSHAEFIAKAQDAAVVDGVFDNNRFNSSVAGYMRDMADIELRSQNLALRKKSLEIQQIEKQDAMPLLKSELLLNTIAPNMDSLTSMGIEYAKSYRGDPDGLKGWARSMVTKSIMNSPNIVESAAKGGLSPDWLQGQADALGEQLSDYLVGFHSGKLTEWELKKSKSQYEMSVFNTLNKLPAKAKAAIAIGSKYNMDSAIGSRMFETQFGKMSTVEAPINITGNEANYHKALAKIAEFDKTFSGVTAETFAEDKTKQREFAAFYREVASDLQSIASNEGSNFGGSSFRYYYALSKSPLLAAPEMRDVKATLDQLYGAAFDALFAGSGVTKADLERDFNANR